MIITQSATASFDPSFNSFQLPTARKQKSLPKQVPQKRTCHSLPLSPRTNRQRTTDLERVQQVIHQALAFLRDEYETHLHASNVFPPEISPSHIRASVASYENEIFAATQRAICCSCGKLVRVADLYQLLDEDPLIQILEGCLW
jgi:hypothetical protein